MQAHYAFIARNLLQNFCIKYVNIPTVEKILWIFQSSIRHEKGADTFQILQFFYIYVLSMPINEYNQNWVPHGFTIPVVTY